MNKRFRHLIEYGQAPFEPASTSPPRTADGVRAEREARIQYINALGRFVVERLIDQGHGPDFTVVAEQQHPRRRIPFLNRLPGRVGKSMAVQKAPDQEPQPVWKLDGRDHTGKFQGTGRNPFLPHSDVEDLVLSPEEGLMQLQDTLDQRRTTNDETVQQGSLDAVMEPLPPEEVFRRANHIELAVADVAVRHNLDIS